jgi:hypothetical protein
MASKSTKSSSKRKGSGKRAPKDLAPRKGHDVRGGTLASSVLKKKDDAANAVISKI